MRAYILQDGIRGPWRWAIVENKQTLAASPKRYRKPGQARNGLKKFLAHAIEALVVDVPDVQLKLPFEMEPSRTRG